MKLPIFQVDAFTGRSAEIPRRWCRWRNGSRKGHRSDRGREQSVRDGVHVGARGQLRCAGSRRPWKWTSAATRRSPPLTSCCSTSSPSATGWRSRPERHAQRLAAGEILAWISRRFPQKPSSPRSCYARWARPRTRPGARSPGGLRYRAAVRALKPDSSWRRSKLRPDRHRAGNGSRLRVALLRAPRAYRGPGYRLHAWLVRSWAGGSGRPGSWRSRSRAAAASSCARRGKRVDIAGHAVCPCAAKSPC